MAALQLPPLLLCLSVAALLISPSHSQTCASKNFHSDKNYTNCIELPTLNAVLHWDYKSTDRFPLAYLSIAFLARPASPSGWIAWGINPDKAQMVGTQALIAFRDDESDVVGSFTVRAFYLNSKQPAFPSSISFVVPAVSAAYDGEVMGIFATLEIPKELKSVYHVWNVGGGMRNGAPAPHAFEKENLNSVGSLDLVNGGGAEVSGGGGTGNGTGTTGGAAGPTTAAGSTGGGGRGHSGGDRVGSCGFGLFGSVLVMAASLMIWT